MAQEVREGIYDLLAARGVSRRDFLKYCGSVAALLGLSETFAPQIAAAVESGAKLKPTVWLDMGLCTGCTESTAQVGNPNVADIVLDLLSINYMETIMAAAGAQAEDAKAATIEAGGYILIVEGTVMTGEGGNTLRIAGKTGMEHLKEVCEKADAIVAVGSCGLSGGAFQGCYGVVGGLNEVIPVHAYVPGCPPRPEAIIYGVVALLNSLKPKPIEVPVAS